MTAARFHLAVVLLAFIACAKDQPLIVSGEAMVQLAHQFRSTAELMERSLDSGAITKEQYKKWVTFGKKFQVMYPLAVDMWKLARLHGDKDMEEQMLLKVNELYIDLITFGRTF